MTKHKSTENCGIGGPVNIDNSFFQVTMKQRITLIGDLSCSTEKNKWAFKFLHCMHELQFWMTQSSFSLTVHLTTKTMGNLINKTLLIAAGNITFVKMNFIHFKILVVPNQYGE